MREPIEIAAVQVESTDPTPATLADAELTAAFVAPFNIMSVAGRVFLAFKKPGADRVSFFEFLPPATLHDLGVQTGAYYKSGDGGVGFYGPTNKPYFFSTESPDPKTGADRVSFFEFLPPATLHDLGVQTGAYYKSGDGGVGFTARRISRTFSAPSRPTRRPARRPAWSSPTICR